MIRTLVAAACVALAGCATGQNVQVKVPVPVECKESVPDRPAMPTEALGVGVSPFVLTRAALAEIDEREAYELKLRAALVACTSPLGGRASGSP